MGVLDGGGSAHKREDAPNETTNNKRNIRRDTAGSLSVSLAKYKAFLGMNSISIVMY